MVLVRHVENDMVVDREIDWFDEGIKVDYDDESDESGEDGMPVVKIPKDLRSELVQTWNNILIVKYLCNPIVFYFFKQYVTKLWNVKGRMVMIDVGSGCYIVKFDTANDCKHVLLDGPWKLFDNYVVA